MTNINVSDMEVGYKVFRAEVFKDLQIHSNRFGFEPEITMKVAKMGCRIYEVPVSYHGRTYAEGKKIGWRDGLAALCHILYYRFYDGYSGEQAQWDRRRDYEKSRSRSSHSASAGN